MSWLVIVTIAITIRQNYGQNYDYQPSPTYQDRPQPVYVPMDDLATSASSEYAAPRSGYHQLESSSYGGAVGGPDTFQTSFTDTASLENIRPARDSRLEDCYCVPLSQCPANKIVGGTVKDYSSLINPRNTNLNADFTSAARTLLGSEENTSEEHSEEILDSILKTEVFGRARSLESVILAADNKEEERTVKKTLLRQRRDSIAQDEEKDKQVTAKSLAGGKAVEEDPQGRTSEIDNSDLADVVIQDKSLETLTALSGDISEKVGSVGNSVSSGVSKIFSNLIGTSTSTGQLQPTIGVSFGLPQAYPGHAGYPQGTVGSTNPFYTAQQGLQVGPVNLNPLFSLQAGTTDTGDLAVKPLVNLHLTPNGCGILGCDKNYNDYADVSKTVLDAITNPFGIFSEDESTKHGISADYTSPQTSYSSSSSYGVPGTSYNAPSTGYGAPSPSYGTPSHTFGLSSQSYEVPSQSYGAPSQSYGAPSQSYGSPSQSYGAPGQSYGAPSQSYRPPKESYSAPSPPYETILSSYEKQSSNNLQQASYHKKHQLSDTKVDSLYQNYLSDNSNHIKRNAKQHLDTNHDSQVPHHQNLHHELNSQFDPNQPLTHQLESFQNVAQQLTDKRSISLGKQFGPDGFRPPTCGGAGSGFVCCSVSDVAGHGPETVRDTRQPQEDNQVSVGQFSRQGQCGRRNAQGVTGRINNPAQTVNEGDTEFGKQDVIHMLILKLLCPR